MKLREYNINKPHNMIHTIPVGCITHSRISGIEKAVGNFTNAREFSKNFDISNYKI